MRWACRGLGGDNPEESGLQYAVVLCSHEGMMKPNGLPGATP